MASFPGARLYLRLGSGPDALGAGLGFGSIGAGFLITSVASARLRWMGTMQAVAGDRAAIGSCATTTGRPPTAD